jgi:hypothetical protein
MSPRYYRHEVLLDPTNHIWLLRILRTRTKGNLLDCQLLTVRLDQCQKTYNALSYMWGTGDSRDYPGIGKPETGCIVIGCRRFRIRLHLLQFLETYQKASMNEDKWTLSRNPSEESLEARMLWIDAICIRQGNIEERNAQVQIMAEIYRSSHTVVTWFHPLAESFPGPRLTHESITNLNRILKSLERVPEHDWHNLKHRNTILDHMFNPIGRRSMSILVCRLLTPLCEHPYWERMWIVQEICHGDQVILFTEHEVWPLECIERIVDMLWV